MRRRVVSTEEFSVKYDGPALAEHRMDVKTLAPALLSLAEALQSAQRVIDPMSEPVAVEIQATNEGSFEIALILSEATRGAIAFLTSPGANATANLAALSAVFWEAVSIVKRLAGRHPAKVEPIANGRVKITLPDGTMIETDGQAAKVALNVVVRDAMRGMLAPLEGDGVDSFEARTATESVSVTKPELPAFDPPDEALEDETRETVIQLKTATLDGEGRGWRATKGGEAFSVVVADKAFLDRTANRAVQFGAGDMLRVRMRERQARTRTGLRMERTILDVIELIPGGRQIPIDGWGEGDA